MDKLLLERFHQGDRQALARLLSLAARGESVGPVHAPARAGRVVAFTGGGGVGKSSLIGKLIPHARAKNQTVAVLACDPKSPVSGGALLGDRFRMGSQNDDGVFIRSLAAAGGRGAVADHLDLMIHLLEAFGFGLIFLETVGAGQGDVAVRQLADIVVLLLQPEAGDDIQWEKAGVLEVADVIVVNKADLPGADQTAAQVRNSLALSHGAAPVILVSNKTGQGIDDLWQALIDTPARRTSPSDQDLLRQAQALLAERFHSAGPNTPLRHFLENRKHLSENEAAAELLRLLVNP